MEITMNYEEKYNNLVAAIKQLQEANPSDEVIQNWVEDNVPELKESEDEMIRKSLIGHLKECRNNTRSEVMIGEYAKWIAWLKKQSEHNTAYKEGQKFNVGDKVIVHCWHGRNDFDFKMYDGKEGVICRVWKLERNLSGNICVRLPNGFNRCFYESELELVGDNQEIDKEELAYDKNREHAWTEEDEVKINRIVACLENLNVADNDILLKDVEWLKSFKDRYTWKPTKQQLLELRCVISGCSFETPILLQLEEDLKKLL
jgi:hypothetical protein